jgi:dienelactone hydrolase
MQETVFSKATYRGTPMGRLVKINATIDAYVATPPTKTTKPAILFLSDILGLWQNNKLHSDRFAVSGFPTVAVDQFNGDPYPLLSSTSEFGAIEPTNTDLTTWVTHGSDGKNPHTPEAVDPIISAALAYLHATFPGRRIAAVGYCFGAKYLVRHMRGPGSIEAGFVAHPSYVEEEELASARGPFSIAAAETDLIFPVEKRIRSEEILKERGEPWSISVYGGVKHGFAIRGDHSDERNVWAEEEAFAQAVRFLER